MEPHITVRKNKEAGLANGEVGYDLQIFRCHFLLTEKEAKKLLVYLFDEIVAEAAIMEKHCG